LVSQPLVTSEYVGQPSGKKLNSDARQNPAERMRTIARIRKYHPSRFRRISNKNIDSRNRGQQHLRAHFIH
jgi:hypothetical protein